MLFYIDNFDFIKIYLNLKFNLIILIYSYFKIKMVNNVDIEKKIPKTKQIIYHYFNDMLNYTNSEFYKNILIKCSRSKFLKGFSIEVVNDNETPVYIVKTRYSKKKNFIKYIEITGSSYQNFCKFIDFLKNNDIYELNNINNLTQPSVPQLWSKLKANIKKKYLADYTLRLCEGNINLSKLLYSKIMYGLTMGYIQNSDIIIDQNSILNIKNILFEDNNIKFIINEKNIKQEEKDEQKNQLPKISQLWVKYLSNLFKKSENEDNDDLSLYEKEYDL